MPTPSKRRLVVLGVDRSGTSCVAGVLHHLGVPMNATPAHRDKVTQPTGYFEDPAFNLCSTRAQLITAAPDSDGHNPNAYKSYVAERRDWELWGIKDPRLVRTLPMFLEALDVRPEVIVVLRNVPDILRSWERCGADPAVALECLMLRDALVLKLIEDKVPVFAVNYSRLVRNAHRIGDMARELRLEPSADQLSAAEAFIDPALDHGEQR